MPYELMPAAPASELADFDAVIRLHQPSVFRFILASLRDRDAAEELSQECLLRAFQARRRFRGQSSVRTWLMHIAVNLIRSHLANARLRFWRRTQRAGMDASLAEAWLADQRLSPEGMAEARQRIAAVWDAAGALPRRQRTVFLLRFVEDMELLEIAEVTGMKEGTVKTHLFRALESVRRRIEEKK